MSAPLTPSIVDTLMAGMVSSAFDKEAPVKKKVVDLALRSGEADVRDRNRELIVRCGGSIVELSALDNPRLENCIAALDKLVTTVADN